MNKVFEKILERLEEERHPEICGGWETMRIDRAKEIVHEVAEEYNNGWIPCSERLPDKNGMYLCSQNTYDIVTNKKLIDISTEYVEFYDGKWMRAKNLVVTHWQPLPEPYQPKGE